MALLRYALYFYIPLRFLTGFPGFLGSALLPRLLARDTQPVACLVQPKFFHQAQQKLVALGAANRVTLCPGDLTMPGLGLDAPPWLQDVREVYHIAAAYDLSVERALAIRVNVVGTQHVLEFARHCPRLERFHYISTCFVSGRHEGVFSEEDLDVGQTFNNHYEETKFLAEVEVQAAMAAGLPTTIYRPSIVVGDSQTGTTQKYDGPYAIIRWIMRQPVVAVVPVVGETRKHTVNLVPRDYVMDAVAYLSAQFSTAGQVFHLCDPAPRTVGQLLDLIEQATQRKLLRVPLPTLLAKGMLRRVRPLQRLMQIAPESVDYFTHPTRFACDKTQAALDKSGIICPPIETYIDALVAYVRQHPDVPSAAMV